MNYDKEGAGVSKTEDRRPGFVRFFYVIGHRFWQIVVLNALYIFACLPIVTIGPATAGMTYVLRNYSQEKHADMFSDFVDKCKEHFKKGVFCNGSDGSSGSFGLVGVQLLHHGTNGRNNESISSHRCYIHLLYASVGKSLPLPNDGFI